MFRWCITLMCLLVSLQSFATDADTLRHRSANRNRGLFNLFHRETVCIYYVNPLSYLYDSSYDVEQLFRDSDFDGVFDSKDKEPNTDALAAVNIFGVTTDFDADGCPDHLDPEPCSSVILPIEDCKNVVQCVGEIIDMPCNRKHADEKNKWILPYIFFDLHDATIRADALPALNQIVELMEHYEDLLVEVIGYPDTRMITFETQALANNRAYNAIQYLKSKGVSEDRLSYVYLTPPNYLFLYDDSCGNECGLNRRVEFHVVEHD